MDESEKIFDRIVDSLSGYDKRLVEKFQKKFDDVYTFYLHHRNDGLSAYDLAFKIRMPYDYPVDHLVLEECRSISRAFENGLRKLTGRDDAIRFFAPAGISDDLISVRFVVEIK